jgi:hypothetical protein
MLLVIPCLFLFLLIILIGVVIAISRKRASTAPPLQPQAAVNNPVARNQRREAILEKLAQKEITRTEAEQQLLELDQPLPETMPMAPPPKGGCGSGCLLAVACGLVLLVVTILLLMSLSFVGVKTTVSKQHRAVQLERMEKMKP